MVRRAAKFAFTPIAIAPGSGVRAVVSSPSAQIGELVAERYEVESVLAEGGMAWVFAAHDHRLNRSVALKIIKRELAPRPAAIERFVREGRIAAALQHPSVVEVYDLGRLGDGLPYLVMPRLLGQDLGQLLERTGAQSIRTIAHWLAGPASAIDTMHAYDMIHRDIKPENLFLTHRPGGGAPSVLLMDFGIARLADGSRLTKEGMMLGTALYMAPESTLPNPSTDVYAFATTLFELITGERPFVADSPVELITLKMCTEAPRLSQVLGAKVPRALDALFERALSKFPHERPPTCGGLLRELELFSWV